jgi:acetyltransferase
MIGEIKSSAILSGFRGKPPADRAAIADLLLTVSEVVVAYPAILEVDLNPVIVHEKGLTIVDARIILKKGNALRDAEGLVGGTS